MMKIESKSPLKTEKRRKICLKVPKLTFKRRKDIHLRIVRAEQMAREENLPLETVQVDRHILWNKLADVEADNDFLRDEIKELRDWKEKVEGSSALMSELRRLREQLLEKNKLIRQYRLGLKTPRGFRLVKKPTNKLPY